MSLSTPPPEAMPSRLSEPPAPAPLKLRSPSPELPKTTPSSAPLVEATTPPDDHVTPSAPAPAPAVQPPEPSPAPQQQPQAAAEPDPTADEPAEEPYEPIDMETFHQILDLDEDDTQDFSRGMAWAYFSQASTTFVEMDEALAAKDLTKLSSLGHFLKGSSAALGVSRVQESCEEIQHFGQLRDEAKGTDLTPADALARIGPLLTRVKREYDVAEKWLKDWYEKNGGTDD